MKCLLVIGGPTYGGHFKIRGFSVFCNNGKPQERLFQITNLLAHLLDKYFQVDGALGDFYPDGFGAEGISLSVEFLHKEI